MSDEPEFLCDITHVGIRQPAAAWAFIGESGDLYLCDHHYQAIPDPGPNWQPIP